MKTPLDTYLSTAVEGYRRAADSFEVKILPGARKFADMGVGGTRALEEPEQIEKGLRDVPPG
ncbi:MAG: hypothetical protein A2V91_03760 [Candidatus Muproteobacteria bacterium RBG_16_64_10]|uniref:Uncharacterized protein n=1 Tax=Candidatus Muproteobacteria bacterium RBG_16_64_10 TaxID=1817757 RepID=A0A1F6SYK5_9PROT|nr:MAG: hypothetical protein A2V91_03760 [Candidatus Muproteobacteria bacterium RBG_16_64_10]